MGKTCTNTHKTAVLVNNCSSFNGILQQLNYEYLKLQSYSIYARSYVGLSS